MLDTDTSRSCSLTFAKSALDYVAMDISRKKPLCACKRAHRAESGTNRPKYSLLNGSRSLEFRTTVKASMIKVILRKSAMDLGWTILSAVLSESGQVLSPDSCKAFPGRNGRNRSDCIP